MRTPAPLSALLLVAALIALPVQARLITDMAGRQVEVPERIQRVFGSAPPLNVLLHAVAPDTLTGLSFPVTSEARPYFPARLQSLPVVGGIFGMGQQMNPETVLALRPDVALAWKSPFIDQGLIERAFAKTGIPVIFIQLDTLSDWPAALRYTGQLLGQQKTADKQARDVERTLDEVRQVVARIPEARRPRVYYAEGPDGLATDCNRSFHTEAIELAGGYNVYRCQPRDHMGMERISLEQVIAFDPEIIITHERNFAAAVRGDPRWQSVGAVRNGRIHLVPRWPHSWIDRPPSLMRVLGTQWLASIFHPQDYSFDVHARTRGFYQLFLGVSPSDAQIDALFR